MNCKLNKKTDYILCDSSNSSLLLANRLWDSDFRLAHPIRLYIDKCSCIPYSPIWNERKCNLWREKSICLFLLRNVPRHERALCACITNRTFVFVFFCLFNWTFACKTEKSDLLIERVCGVCVCVFARLCGYLISTRRSWMLTESLFLDFHWGNTICQWSRC